MKRKLLSATLFAATCLFSNSSAGQSIENYPSEDVIVETVISDDGEIYALMKKGEKYAISKYEESSWKEFTVKDQKVDIGLAPDNKLMVGVDDEEDERLLFYNSNGTVEGEFSESSIRESCLKEGSSAYRKIIKSSSGNTFVIVTAMGGPRRYDVGPAGAYMIKMNPEDTSYSCLGTSIGAFQEAVEIVDDEVQYFVNMGVLSVLTPEGVTRIGEDMNDTVSFKNIDYKNDLYATLKERKTILKYSGDDWTKIVADVPFDDIYSFEVDNQDNIWVFDRETSYGVYFYNGKIWQNVTTAHGLLSNEILSVHLDKNDKAWITTPEGVSVISPEVLSTTEINRSKKVGVWPNPANSHIQVEDYKKYQKYKIYSSTGVLVSEGEVKSDLNISGLENGLYQLSLVSENQEVVRTSFIKN